MGMSREEVSGQCIKEHANNSSSPSLISPWEHRSLSIWKTEQSTQPRPISRQKQQQLPLRRLPRITVLENSREGWRVTIPWATLHRLRQRTERNKAFPRSKVPNSQGSWTNKEQTPSEKFHLFTFSNVHCCLLSSSHADPKECQRQGSRQKTTLNAQSPIQGTISPCLLPPRALGAALQREGHSSQPSPHLLKEGPYLVSHSISPNQRIPLPFGTPNLSSSSP